MKEQMNFSLHNYKLKIISLRRHQPCLASPETNLFSLIVKCDKQNKEERGVFSAPKSDVQTDL